MHPIKRFLYWFHFRTSWLGGIPELERLSPEERMQVIIDAQQASWWDRMNDKRGLVWVLVFPPAAFGVGALYLAGYPTLGLLCLIGLGVILGIGDRSQEIMRRHVMNILAKKGETKGVDRPPR